VDMVRGASAAQSAVERFDSKLSDEEKQLGVRHFSQRTTKKV